MTRLHKVCPRRIATSINDSFDQHSMAINGVDRNEDLLSHRLVASIRAVLSEPTDQGDQPNNVGSLYMAIQAYKVTGRLEYDHGDIAIVVTDLDHHITGTGFYEAKAESHGDHYPSYKMRQLRRLESKTPKLAIAMYERKPKPVSDDLYDCSLAYLPSGGQRQFRCCRVLPASRVRQYPRLEDAVHQMMPSSFGHHFVTRYLLGPDLDISRPPSDAIDRWVRVTRRAVPEILVIAISRNSDAQFSGDPMGILPGSTLEELSIIEKLPGTLHLLSNPSVQDSHTQIGPQEPSNLYRKIATCNPEAGPEFK